MIGIDTNIIVRYLVADDPGQFRRARALIESERVFVCTTVLLEVEWVLRRLYRLDRPVVIRALLLLARLPTVTLEAPRLMGQALEWSERGMDFADALHLASSAGSDAFASFDKDLAKAAARAGAPSVRTP
jgi:predicted nucleic acid-binding protein